MALTAVFLILFAGHVQSQMLQPGGPGTVTRSYYADSSCSGNPTTTQNMIQGLCIAISVPGQPWSSTVACNSTHATIFFCPDGLCSETVTLVACPLDACVRNGNVLDWVKVKCNPWDAAKANTTMQIMYAEAACTMPLATVAVQDLPYCYLVMNPPSYKMVCNTGDTVATAYEYGATSCAGASSGTKANQCKLTNPITTPGYYTRYTCVTPKASQSSQSTTTAAPTSDPKTTPPAASASSNLKVN
jgi:hypothetical protein